MRGFLAIIRSSHDPCGAPRLAAWRPTALLPNAHPAVEANLGEVRQAVGVVRVGLVLRHVECLLGMARVDADGRQSFRGECVIEPHRQRSRFENHAFCVWRLLADDLGNALRIRRTLSALDRLTISPN